MISKRLFAAEDPQLKRDVNMILKNYLYYTKRQKSLPANARGHENMSEVLLFKEHYTSLASTNLELSTIQPSKKRKSLTELSSRMQHIRTDKILNDLKDFIDSENKENNTDSDMTLTQILGYLIYRINYSSNKKIAEIGKSILEENFTNEASFDNLDAIALMHDLTLTKGQMRNAKSYLGQKNIQFPNSNDLLDARKLLKPEIDIELDGIGVSVNYQRLIEMATSSLINCVKMDNLITIDPTKPLKAVYKEGCDGAGSQTFWNS